jgi:hypothetical protein
MVKSAYGEKNILPMVGDGTLRVREVFGMQLFELPGNFLAESDGILPDVQEVDAELADILAVKDHQKLFRWCCGNRTIQIPNGIVKVYKLGELEFVRISDFSQYCRYALVPKLPTIRVGHGIYVALEAIRKTVDKPYAVITV